eukprot:11168640-Lingulodinium_polyedra.AAC.1
MAASRRVPLDVLDAVPFDANRPWGAVFSRSVHPAALGAQAFWNSEVRERAVVCLSRVTPGALAPRGPPVASDPNGSSAAAVP